MERRKETNKALQLLFSIIYNSESAFFSQLHIFVIPYFVSFTADSKCWVRGAKEAEVGSWGTFRRLWMFPQWAESETEPWALRPQERTDRNGLYPSPAPISLPWNQHLTKHLHPSVQQWHKMQIGYDSICACMCASVQDNSVTYYSLHLRRC